MYNRSEIMKAAWNKVRRFGWTMSNALRICWMEAKQQLPIHTVWAENIGSDRPVMIAEGLTYEQASEREWENRFRFDRVWVAAA